MKWPWHREPEIDSPHPVDTGGKEARERAEEALADVRNRRPAVTAMRLFFVRDLQQNHYGEHVIELFRGGST